MTTEPDASDDTLTTVDIGPDTILRSLFEAADSPPSLFELRQILSEPYDPKKDAEAQAAIWDTVEERLLRAEDPSPSERSDDERYQIHVAWRLTRLHLHLSGHVDRVEPLDGLIASARLPLSAWRQPLDMPLQPSAINTLTRLELADRWRTLVEEPVALLPPENGALPRWKENYAYFALSLHLDPQPPAAFVRARPLAVRDLLVDPHRYWPTPQEMIQHENEILRGIRRKHAQQNTNAAVDWLEDFYGLARDESFALLKACAQSAFVALDAEEARALSLARWEEILKSAALDPRAKAAIQKYIDTIHGLGRMEAEDAAVDFFNVIGKVSEKFTRPKRPSDASTAPPGLPG